MVCRGRASESNALPTKFESTLHPASHYIRMRYMVRLLCERSHTVAETILPNKNIPDGIGHIASAFFSLQLCAHSEHIAEEKKRQRLSVR